MPGVTHKRATDRDPDATPAPEVDQEQDAADQQVAVRESHGAIEREDLPDERGESPEVDARDVDVRSGGPPDHERHKTVAIGGGTHVVTHEDTLWKISKSSYGEGRHWKKIRAANEDKVAARRNGMRDLLHAGDTLALPVLRVPVAEVLPQLTEGGFVGEALVGKGGIEPLDEKERMQLVQIFEATGQTYPAMLAEQRAFWAEQAEAQGVSIGEYLRMQLEGTPGKAQSTTAWDVEVKEKRSDEWRERFWAASDLVLATDHPQVKAAIQEAQSHGGGAITFDPEAMERKNAFATGGTWNLKVGMDWVEAVEDGGVERIAANLLHEMIGHPQGPWPFAANFAVEAVEGLDQKDRDAVDGFGIGLGLGYFEMEIFAELYEFSFDSKENFTDHPFEVGPDGDDVSGGRNHELNDVRNMLAKAKGLFMPSVLTGIVRALWVRVQDDPHIVDQARALFRRDVLEVLGDVF